MIYTPRPCITMRPGIFSLLRSASPHQPHAAPVDDGFYPVAWTDTIVVVVPEWRHSAADHSHGLPKPRVPGGVSRLSLHRGRQRPTTPRPGPHPT